MRSSDLFKWLGTGRIRNGYSEDSISLADGAQAHRDLESRKTTGKTAFEAEESLEPAPVTTPATIKARRTFWKEGYDVERGPVKLAGEGGLVFTSRFEGI